MAKTPWRTWLFVVPASALVGLGAFVAARFWLSDATEPPTFELPSAPRFEPLSHLAERPPGGPSLMGTLVDPDAHPVADAVVFARPAGVPTWALTDATGRFSLPWPPAPEGGAPGEGDIQLSVAAWGFPPMSTSVPWGSASVDVTLPPPEEPTPRLPDVETSPLAARARPALARATDEPLDLELWLEPVEPPEAFTIAVTRRVRCAPDGTFALADLAHGRYRAHVVPGWAAGGSWPDLLVGAPVDLDHPAATAHEVGLELVDGALHGVVVDREGAALEGALALLADEVHADHLWPPRFTDAAGAFRFDDLPAGTYRLVLSAGEARETVSPIELAAGQDLELPLPALAPRASR